NMQVPSKWSSRIWNGGRVVVENTKDNIVFDIWYHKEWHIQLFKRESESKKSLKEYVDDK
ncbi:MAG: hypothetical protein IJ894_11015, partial [Bacteroidales bacterium]|nr:hypothetical protein [Bacteroidales bacterium]